VLEQTSQLPGLKAATFSDNGLFSGSESGTAIEVEGFRPSSDKDRGSRFDQVAPNYFEAVGIPVLKGRGFNVKDDENAPKVAVINQSFVKRFFKPGENPIGRRFGSPGPQSSGDFEIVGVVEDTAYNSATWKDHHMYFLPMTQRVRESARKHPIEEDTSLYAGAIVIQTDHPMGNMQSIARQTLSAINPNLSVVKFQTFDEQIADRFTEDRMITRLMTLVSVLALLLATVGLYGVTAYTVARRTSEIGIRMAIGAQPRDVFRMVIGQGMALALIGVAFGLVGAFGLTRLMASMLFGVGPTDPATFVSIALLLTGVALVACYVPSRRATKVDPVVSLRYE